MKYVNLVLLATAVLGAYVPSEPWTTLTPTATLNSSIATSSLDGSYALSIKTISVASTSTAASSSKVKRAATQIGDGQVQDNTKTASKATKSVAAQITDGQVQKQTKTTKSVAAQITDGQVQKQTKTTKSVAAQITDGQVQKQTTAAAVAQISDGQIQKQTASVLAQINDGQIQHQTVSVVAQINDGQIQHQTASAVAQISDGQVQKQTTAKATATAATQISDGQVQATTAAGASQVSDGQVQESGSASSDDDSSFEQTCVADNSLLLNLTDGVLRDSKGRIGSIVANRQFQFDGPPPQAGAIYAKGWSAVPIDYVEDSTTKAKADDNDKGKSKRDVGSKLALGKQTTFYQCKSGDFYNIYDESIGGQCSEIELVLLQVVDC